MKIRCEQCQNEIECRGRLPRFCEQCGVRLKTSSGFGAGDSSSQSTWQVLTDDSSKGESSCGDSSAGDSSRSDTSSVSHSDADATVPPSGFYQSAQRTGFSGDLANFTIIRQLGAGGMGQVYQARERDSGRMVALKVLSRPQGEEDRTAVERFLLEGQLAAKLSHPCSTYVYEAGVVDGQPFIAMELMPGETLQDEIDRSGPLSVTRAIDVTLNVIDGLIAAHRIGVVHRDVKPSNCFIASDGHVKIGDFGLSKNLVIDANLTKTGTFMGTPSYSSPEQVRGISVDTRSDIYSVGATLFTLLTGRPPFVGDAMSVTAQIISDPPPSLSAFTPGLPRELDRILQQTLKKDPDERYQDLESLREALLPFASHGASLAQIGRRAAAFMADYAGIYLLFQIAGAVAGMFIALNSMSESTLTENQMALMQQRSARIVLVLGVANWFSLLFYFLISEWRWGRTLGKRLFNLRVANALGEKPSLWQATLRSIAIPGAFGVPLISVIARSTAQQDVNLMTMDSIIVSWAQAILPIALPGLICALTMREKNGLRGLHDLISGCRVVQLAGTKPRLIRGIKPMVFEPLPEERRRTLGRFQLVGKLPLSNSDNVFLAQDALLERQSLIVTNPNPNAVLAKDFSMNRSTRNRWLQGGVFEGGRWDAFEYFGGVPFSYVVCRLGRMNWDDIKQPICDLVHELEAAVEEKSLPADVSTSHFMIRPEGKGCLLDFPVNITGKPVSVSGADTEAGLGVCPSQAAAACRLIRDVLEWCLNINLLPQSAIELINEFRRRPESTATIHWLRNRLDDECEKVSAIHWDSRIGVLAVTMGAELSVLLVLLVLFDWFILSNVGYFPIWKIGWSLVVTDLCCGLLGLLTGGGPAFRFFGIEVRNRRGKPAERWRLALRMAFSWLPFCMFAVSFPLFFEVGVEQLKAQSRLPTDISLSEMSNQELAQYMPWLAEIKTHPIQKLIVLLGAATGAVLMVVGSVFSILSPRRGLQDYLAGTQLISR